MRRIWETPGGIHPPENKDQSNQTPIQAAPVPELLVIPLTQHLGTAAEPVVNIGDQVLKGQQIARAQGAFSAPIHAPSSGTIEDIGLRPAAHASGLDTLSIVIRTDGRDQWIELEPLTDWRNAEPTEVLAKIRNAGIVGMGGAGFPTALKLSPPPGKPISTLIINGTECEPYITADDRLMREHADEIIGGARILAWLLNVSVVIIGIEDNKPEAIAAMRAAADEHMDVVSFPTKYPSGGEKQLIQILTGQEIPVGDLPADLGIVCQNTGTARAVFRAIEYGEPLISRITTVTGEAVRKPGNFDVRLGTPVHTLMQLADVDESRVERLVMGGPMMGFALSSDQAPVVKTTNCLLIPTATELPKPPPQQPCIRCGMCAEACPASLLPQQLYWYARSSDNERLEEYNLFDCIECGACAFVCPSSIPLVQYYRSAKGSIRQQREQQRKAEHSRERFEMRQARLQKLEEAKEARRKERAAKAATPKSDTAAESPTAVAPSADKSADIAAAIERAKAKKLAQVPAEQRDIVGEAIERARQKAEQKLSSAEGAEKAAVDNIASLQKRIEKARAKLDEAKAAGAETVDALAAGLAKLESKLAAAQAESQPIDPAPPVMDAAAAAIERAKAKQAARNNAAPEDPKIAIQRSLENTNKKIANAEKKLAQAREQGDESTATLLEQTIANLKQRRDEVRAKLETEA